MTALALAARLALVPRLAMLQPDGCFYLWWAEDFARGDWAAAMADRKPPGLSALIAAVHLCGVPIEAAGRAVSVALGSAASGALFFAFRRASGSVAAAAAGAALYAIQPEAVRAGADVMSEAPFCFFVAAALALGLRARDEGSPAAALGAGALAGLSYLVRPEGLVVAIALGAGLAIQALNGGGEGRARRAAAGALLLGVALAAGPYVAHLSREAGTLTLTRKKSAAALVGSAEVEMYPEAAATPIPPSEERPGLAPELRGLAGGWGGGRAPEDVSLLRSSGRALRRFAEALHPLIAVLGALGVGLLARRPGARVVLLAILGFGAAAALLDWRFHYLDRRHLATAAALGTLFAGAGAAWIGEALGRRRAALAVAFAAALAAVLLPKALAPRFAHRAGLRAASAWLAANGGAGARVMGLWGTEIAYYAGAREVHMPRGSAAQVLAAARAAGCRFIAISVRTRHGDPRPPIEEELARVGLAPSYRAEEATEGDRLYLRLIYRVP